MEDKTPPQKKQIIGSVAAYMMQAVENLTILNNVVNELRWRIHRGDEDRIIQLIRDARKQNRKLMNSLDMALHCSERED